MGLMSEQDQVDPVNRTDLFHNWKELYISGAWPFLTLLCLRKYRLHVHVSKTAELLGGKSANEPYILLAFKFLQ